jgi:pimeloyl-ACP methyl ester carboxylesterase
MVSFDRPGYGGSTAAPFGLVSIARDTAAVVDALGIGRFATLGQSSGGPFSLAAAAVLGERVSRAGVASGRGPSGLIPGAMEDFDDEDRAVLALLPEDPAGAARTSAGFFEPLVSLIRRSSPAEIVAAFKDALSVHDRALLNDERLASAFGESMKEALRQGASGGGWDSVACAGSWEIDLSTIECPVLLWYGEEEQLRSHGVWLSENVPNATLVVRPGEGHLGIVEHLSEMLAALTS